MMRGMYAAVSGLKIHQIALDVTANDLANVNTIGFKSSRTTFKDALTQMQRGGAAQTAGNAGSNAAQVGLGTVLSSIDNIMSNGATQATGVPTDVAIQGEGWFRVGTSSGAGPDPANPLDPTRLPTAANTNYTRAGNLARNDQGYLTTGDGLYLVGSSWPTGTTTPAAAAPCYIRIPPNATDVSIAADGAVSFIPPTGYTPATGMPPITNGRVIAGYVTLAKFSNDGGLERVSFTRWRATGASGAEAASTPGMNGFGSTIGGSLEMSNVDLATEFTDMISAQRGFQANSRVISVADEMLEQLVNLKR
jgi:flagellar hook protein FlgE